MGKQVKVKNFKGNYDYYTIIEKFASDGFEFWKVKCQKYGKTYYFNQNIIPYCEQA